jgi:putative ABC transport system permease protein
VTSLAAALVEGTLFPDTGRNPILISQRNAEKLKIRLGSKVVLTFSDKNGDVTGAAFRVCGVFRTPSSGFDDGTVFVRKTDLAPLIGFDHAHEIAVRLDEGQILGRNERGNESHCGNRGRGT